VLYNSLWATGQWTPTIPENSGQLAAFKIRMYYFFTEVTRWWLQHAFDRDTHTRFDNKL
jgi:hypothetical protein